MLPLISISLALVVRGDARFNAPPLRQCEGALRPFQGTQRDDESAIGSTLAAIGGLVERVYVLCARRCERTPELAPSAWRHAFVVDGLRYDRCARLDGATRQQSRATLTHLAVLQDAQETLALNATVLVLEDDAVATAAPPWSRARLGEFDATVLRAAVVRRSRSGIMRSMVCSGFAPLVCGVTRPNLLWSQYMCQTGICWPQNKQKRIKHDR